MQTHITGTRPNLCWVSSQLQDLFDAELLVCGRVEYTGITEPLVLMGSLVLTRAETKQSDVKSTT